MAFTDWVSVTSSNLSDVRYDDDSGTLQIRFKSGVVYEWYGVEQGTAEELAQADSPGKYLNSHIHGLFGAGRKV